MPLRVKSRIPCSVNELQWRSICRAIDTDVGRCRDGWMDGGVRCTAADISLHTATNYPAANPPRNPNPAIIRPS